MTSVNEANVAMWTKGWVNVLENVSGMKFVGVATVTNHVARVISCDPREFPSTTSCEPPSPTCSRFTVLGKRKLQPITNQLPLKTSKTTTPNHPPIEKCKATSFIIPPPEKYGITTVADLTPPVPIYLLLKYLSQSPGCHGVVSGDIEKDSMKKLFLQSLSLSPAGTVSGNIGKDSMRKLSHKNEPILRWVFRYSI